MIGGILLLIVGGMIATIALTFLAILAFALLQGPKSCEQCGMRLPMIRNPPTT